MRYFFYFAALLLWPLLASAQLAVTVLPMKTTAQKAVVPLALKNNFNEEIESARAACFILDARGKMVGQSTQWVIGGSNTNALAPGATNAFNFVVPINKPVASTNLQTKVTFSRLVLEGGKVADPRQVTVTQASE